MNGLRRTGAHRPAAVQPSLTTPGDFSGMERRVIASLALPAAVAATFMVLAALWLGGQAELYRRVLMLWGVAPFAFPFLDIHGVLASLQCSAQGIDVYTANPCDALGRVFFYSPLLLWLTSTGIGATATPVAGLIIDAVFIASLALLPAPRRPRDRLLLLCAAVSSTVALGLERANIDMLIFAIVVIAARLLARGIAARVGAYALIAAAALLKFYPVVLFVLALREQTRIFVAVAAAAAAAFAIFVAAYHAELMLALGNVPHDKWFQDLFGARNLPYGLAALGVGAAPGLLLSAMMVAAGAGALMLGAWRGTEAYSRLTTLEATCLVAGAVLIVGCFFAGQSFVYRSVFLLLTLPGLTTMARDAGTSRARTFFATVAGMVVLLMWEEAFRRAVVAAAPQALLAFWICRELAWWTTMAVLGGILVRFVRSAEIVGSMSGWHAAQVGVALRRRFSAR